MDKKRVGYIDLYRSVGIILMVLGHIGVGKGYDLFIHAFNMPMFFMISGYFYREKPMLDRIKHNCKVLLIPYLINGFAYYLFGLIRNATDFSIKHIITLLSGLGTSPVTGAVQWFLTAMFFADIIYATLNKALKNQIICTSAVLIISVFGMVISHISQYVPWSIPAAMASQIFYHIGSGIRNTENKTKKPIGDMVKPWYLMVSLPILVTTIVINGSVNMRTGEYNCYPLFWLNAAGMCTIIWVVCFWLEKVLGKWWSLTGILPKLTSIGRNSIIYLCANQMVIWVCSAVVRRLVDIQSYYGGIFVKMAVICLSFVALKIIETIVMHTQLKVLFGK